MILTFKLANVPVKHVVHDKKSDNTTNTRVLHRIHAVYLWQQSIWVFNDVAVVQGQKTPQEIAFILQKTCYDLRL